MVTFQGQVPHERPGNSTQSRVDLLNLSENRGGDIRSPHQKETLSPIAQHLTMLGRERRQQKFLRAACKGQAGFALDVKANS